MKSYFLTFFTALLCVSLPQISHGNPHGKGHGNHKGKGKGGMPEELRGTIHQLFDAHEGIDRSVELTPKGYLAKTTSADPETAKALQMHVAQMKTRFKEGLSVRRWDPAFVEFREHYDDLKIKIENIKNGVRVEVSGTTKTAIQVAQNHAKIISGFVKHGNEKMHAIHPTAKSHPDIDKRE